MIFYIINVYIRNAMTEIEWNLGSPESRRLLRADDSTFITHSRSELLKGSYGMPRYHGKGFV